MRTVVVEAELRPSEDKGKVLLAISNFLDYDQLEEEKGGISGTLIAGATSLSAVTKLHNALRKQRILDAARKHMIKGRKENGLFFMLHKQAAAVGKVSFVDSESESPCGPLKFYIFHGDPLAVIDWLAPRTSRGVPIREYPMP